MAESTKVITIDEETRPARLVYVRQAKEYVKGLDDIINSFHQLLNQNDALVMTVRVMKHHKHNISSQFDIMKVNNIDILMGMIKDSNCVQFHQSLQEEGVQCFDPEGDLTSGQEILKQLLPKKCYSMAVKEHIIMVFDHLSNTL